MRSFTDKNIQNQQVDYKSESSPNAGKYGHFSRSVLFQGGREE